MLVLLCYSPLVYFRVIEAQELFSMDFLTLTTLKTLWERISLAGSVGCAMMWAFKIFGLILQRGKTYSMALVWSIGFFCIFLYHVIYLWSIGFQQNMWENILRELSLCSLSGSTGILATIRALLWTIIKVHRLNLKKIHKFYKTKRSSQISIFLFFLEESWYSFMLHWVISRHH